MPFIVCQVRRATKPLKEWVGVKVAESATLDELFYGLVSGTLDGREPIEADGVVHTFVGDRKTNLTRVVGSDTTLSDVINTLGNFVEFALDEVTPTEPPRQNAFTLMLAAAKNCSNVPKPISTPRNQKERLKNDVIDWLAKNHVGWSLQTTETLGQKFVNTLCDVMWYIDGNHATLQGRSCGVPQLLSHFVGYNKPENRKRKKIDATALSSTELLAIAGSLFDLGSHGFMKADAWKSIFEAVLQLATNLRKYAIYLKQSNDSMAEHHKKVAREINEMEEFKLLSPCTAIKPSFQARYRSLIEAVDHADMFEIICVNEHCPSEPAQKYVYINNMKLTARCVFYKYTGSRENLAFVWKIPISPDDQLLEKNKSNVDKIRKSLPMYHTRAMRQSFVEKFGRVTTCKPAVLREAYRRLTGDRSAANSLSEAEIDKRVAEMLDTEDEDIICDLRLINPGRPQQYQEFLEACQMYIANTLETAVDERRHDDISKSGDIITHLATAMNTRHLYNEVLKTFPSEKPIPSLQWLRLQFWPRRCNTLASMRYHGTLKIKFMVQARQFRHTHEDCHYASALFRYEREFSVRYRTFATFVCSDDKHSIKVGEPGFPVAAAERGKEVLVSMESKFQVGDHDFTKISLVPSVHFCVTIPEDGASPGQFYAGKVCVGLKNNVFQPSSGLRHMTELNQILRSAEINQPILLLYTDGGPDHRPTYLSNKCSLLAYFLENDLDYLLAVRTPPYHSWKNPAERIMSVINCALQSVGMMRSPTEMEDQLKGCKNMKDVRKLAEKHPGIEAALSDSLQQPISLLSKLMMALHVKDEPFHVFPAAEITAMEELWANVLMIDNTLKQTDTTTKSIERKTAFINFLKAHCVCRHYFFSVKKCGEEACNVCKPPRIPKEIFDTLHHLPDPEPLDAEHYKPFSDLYGTPTSEKYRPSLQCNKSTKKHGLPFPPSGQFAKNTGVVVQCNECDKWRCLYSKKKLNKQDREKVEGLLSDVLYSCGSNFADIDGPEATVFETVFVKLNITCNDNIEKPYYAAGYEDICFFCGGLDNLDTESAEHYPICIPCKETAKPEKKSSRRKFSN